MQPTPQIEQHLTANMNLRKRDIIVGNFLGGLSWGIGSVVGIGLITLAIGWLLSALGVFNSIGNALAPLNEIKNLNQLNQNLPQIPNLK